MVEYHSYETNKIYPNINPTLSDNQQFRLNQINEIKDCFLAEIKEREKGKRVKGLVNIMLFFIILTVY